MGIAGLKDGGGRNLASIEIKPHRWSWKVFEPLGGKPVFLEKDQAISYARNPGVLSFGGRDSYCGFNWHGHANHSV
jgi:hypothetical protein